MPTLCGCISQSSSTELMHVVFPAGNSQCLLTCKATLENGEMIVHGPLEALPGTPCSTSLVTDGICVDAICTVS